MCLKYLWNRAHSHRYNPIFFLDLYCMYWVKIIDC